MIDITFQSRPAASLMCLFCLLALVYLAPSPALWAMDANQKDAAAGNPKRSETAGQAANATDNVQSLILVVGAPGAEEFVEPFKTWSGRWRKAAEVAKADLTIIGNAKTAASDKPDRERLREAIATCPASKEPLWMVFIGHGTFDGRKAKFNMRGRDVAAAELAEWMKGVKRPVVIINSASASGPFINRLSAPNRVVVTASKSGYEHNFARFGDHLSTAILSGAADLDKDGQTSLLEAFLTASSRVAEFYRQDGRLATEHALLDDNGDKMGTPASFFRGVRATKAAKKGAAVDGQRASQFVLIRSENERAMSPELREQRDALESQIAALRSRKSILGEDEYYRQLEALLTDLATVLVDKRLVKKTLPTEPKASLQEPKAGAEHAPSSDARKADTLPAPAKPPAAKPPA